MRTGAIESPLGGRALWPRACAPGIIGVHLPRLDRSLRELVYKALAELLAVGEKVNRR